MPTYSYRCTECDNAFDIHQAFTDDTLTVCEVCGAPLRKLFNTIGVTFNGSGFYRTDSRGAQGGSSSGSASSDDGSGSGDSGSAGSRSGSTGAGSSGASSSGSGSSGGSTSTASTGGGSSASVA